MKQINLYILLFSLLIFSACVKEDPSRLSNSASFDSASIISGDSDGSGSGGESGLITAGEWNDLENWGFWTDLVQKDENFTELPDFWNFYTNNRVAIHLFNQQGDVINAEVKLVKDDELIWTAMTDNFGMAQFYINAFEKGERPDLNNYVLIVEDIPVSTNLKYVENGINEVNTLRTVNNSNRVELAFIVDATGSMYDEIEFLKKDLEDVIERAQAKTPHNSILTSSVFYRDEGDEYVTKVSDFQNINNTIGFILDQSSGGGGDFPEAVHSALEDCLEQLSWSENAKTKIAFLLLDAPPHSESDVISDIQNSIKTAAKKGIKVIPITASGIDKSTEYLMRSFSIMTNAPYVFITNDSGIGNHHIEASVGDYDVEFLNDLMVRLINKYTE